MKLEKISIDKLNNNEYIKSLELEYSIVYYNDKVEIENNVNKIILEDLQEGRYFSKNKELRVLKAMGGYIATLFIEEDNDKYIETNHLVIDNKFNDVKKVCVKKYLEFDEDGQAFIKYFRPYRVV